MVVRTAGLLLVLVWATSLVVCAQEASDSATAVRALEHQWFVAQSHNDNGALDLIFDNDLVYIEYGGLVTKGAYLSHVKTAKPQPLQIVMEAMTVRTFGNTVIAIGTYRETAKDGKPLPKHWRYIDTWVYEQGRWMLVAAASAPMLK
jgi:uncharacterized protein (TIGR02246 family)